MNKTRKQFLSYIFLMLFALFVTKDICYGKSLPKIDNPLKAAVFYFPSPPVMRCLNHSNIPRTYRKAIVSRKIKLSKTEVIEQNISIGINRMAKSGSKFLIKNSFIDKNGIIKDTINNSPFFDPSKGGKVKPSFLFGFEDVIGVQRKLHVLDMIGNQDLNYVVFLKKTEGMIGNSNYKLELNGQDKTIDGEVKYILNGKGQIGGDTIFISGKEVKKDSYEISEKYGSIEIATAIRVYD